MRICLAGIRLLLTIPIVVTPGYNPGWGNSSKQCAGGGENRKEAAWKKCFAQVRIRSGQRESSELFCSCGKINRYLYHLRQLLPFGHT
jgi:hypothetical protein